MRESVVLNFSRTFVVIDCVRCSGPIVLTSDREKTLRSTHTTFYCAEGHGNMFGGKSDVEQLREELAKKQTQLEFERQRAATNFKAREKAEKSLNSLKRRTSKGVCPCCQRTFVSVGRHMKSKHPNFGAAPERP